MNAENIDVILPLVKLNGETLTVKKVDSSYCFNIFKSLEGDFEPDSWFEDWKKETFGLDIDSETDGWCAIFNCMVLAWSKVPEDVMKASAKKYGVNLDE